jgi:hypothetical protein
VCECGRRLGFAFAVGDLGDLGEHRPKQRPVEVAEPVVAEVADEDEFDVAGVGQAGGGPDPGAGVEPVPQPAFDSPAVTGTAGGTLRKAFIPGGAGGGLRAEAAAADPIGPAEQVRCGAVEVPGAVAAHSQPRTMVL